MKQINIAVDGYAGCGKSTLARDLAKSLNYTFIDTGALYRGITWLVLQENNGSLEDRVETVLRQKPSLTFSGNSNRLKINGIDREDVIREMRVADRVSEIAAHAGVRQYLKTVQQELITRKGIVMEGRDIGTVIMPGAEAKFFITATIEARVNRRLEQLKQQGKPSSWDKVMQNLQERDKKDASREIAPLAKASEAFALDSSQLTREEQLKACIALINPLIDRDQLLPYV